VLPVPAPIDSAVPTRLGFNTVQRHTVEFLSWYGELAPKAYCYCSKAGPLIGEPEAFTILEALRTAKAVYCTKAAYEYRM
jgi:hypothetical protein